LTVIYATTSHVAVGGVGLMRSWNAMQNKLGGKLLKYSGVLWKNAKRE
jgi:hypothetical protein